MEVEVDRLRASAKPSVPEAKHWAGCTLNNYTQEDLLRFEVLIKPLATYFVFGYEVGESGTPHLQFMVSFASKKVPFFVCFVIFTNGQRLTTVKKLLPTAHWEVKSRGSTFKQASDYCKKDGNYTEWGTLPQEQTVNLFFQNQFIFYYQAKATKASLDKWQATLDLAKAGKMEECDPEMQIKYYSTLKKIENSRFNIAPVAMLKWKRMSEGGKPSQIPNKWIYGPTGTGMITLTLITLRC